MNLEDKIIYTVSRINNEIKTVLEDSYPAVWITGEVSGFKTYSSGHSYFNLKDENSQIQAVLFAGFGKNINFVPHDGMQVVVYGKITSYVQRGTYQIQVFTIEQSGKGTLQESFEKLKNKLQREGFFDESRKKTLPFFIKKIALVTSKDGAALHDILKVINQIKSSLDILIYPVKVQGEQAKFEIAEAIEYLNKNHGDIDVMLVGRGGGSLEDLWAFNEEIVARAIYNSKIPVISCVGHEIDYTIADFTADVRAATPSVAAEIIVKNRKNIEDKIDLIFERMSGGIKNILFVCGEKIERFKTSRALSKPHLIYEDKIQHIDECGAEILRRMKEFFILKNTKLELNSQKLNLLSPLNILGKGYAVCSGTNGILKSIKDIKNDDNIKIQFADGKAKARITEVNYEKKQL